MEHLHCHNEKSDLVGFITTNAHRLTDPPNTDHFVLTHRLTDWLSSTYVKTEGQNFHYQLVPVITDKKNKLMQFYILIFMY